ncbi:Plakophilin-4 p0071 [Collichthys lucidus]|uniref:Plakophilin-4 p0071 n=1 Tax=Collichthys lucidus TaxID=240159 RepID=A0A4U5TZY1_COLLU|nr:Plakophilin-4 p0071 [Collichthys lucidus]
MPAPEQSPVTEEGLLLTIRDSSTGRNMEADNTANNILASVKEQWLVRLEQISMHAGGQEERVACLELLLSERMAGDMPQRGFLLKSRGCKMIAVLSI